MALRWLLGFIHLIALPIGMAAVLMRARGLQSLARGGSTATAITADIWWGVAALLWISTGLARYLMGLEKPAGYYNLNWLFHTKMTLLGVILLLEIRPAIVIARWRIALRKRRPLDTSAAHTLATTSYVQLILALLMVIAATGMARGVGVFGN